MSTPFISLKTLSSPPLQLGGREVVVHAQALQLRLPFARLVWNRPVAVSIHQPGAAPRKLPVVDVTRLAQMALLGAAALVALAAWRLASGASRGQPGSV
jgi:hypothetical protein